MSTGFYAGSFDPFTNGHLQVVKTAATLFDEVVIGIGVNPNKDRLFNEESMKLAIEKTLQAEGLTNIYVIHYTGLTSDIARTHDASFFIRGLRNDMDYNYEENIAQINQEIGGIDTLYIRAGQMGFVSSSMVMELFEHGKDVSNYVPSEVLRIISNSHLL